MPTAEEDAAAKAAEAVTISGLQTMLADFQKKLDDSFNKKLDGLDKKYNGQFRDFGEKLTVRQQQEADEQARIEAEKQQQQGKSDSEKAWERKFGDLQKSFEAEKLTRAEAEKSREKTERESAIRTKISSLKLRDEAAENALFAVVKDQITRNSEGKLIVGEDQLPYNEFLSKQVAPGAAYEFMLPPKAVGGANATRTNTGNSAGIDINDIGPGMSDAIRKQAWGELKNVDLSNLTAP
jgi:hypothetical protein